VERGQLGRDQPATPASRELILPEHKVEGQAWAAWPSTLCPPSLLSVGRVLRHRPPPVVPTTLLCRGRSRREPTIVERQNGPVTEHPAYLPSPRVNPPLSPRGRGLRRAPTIMERQTRAGGVPRWQAAWVPPAHLSCESGNIETQRGIKEGAACGRLRLNPDIDLQSPGKRGNNHGA
jgi:hypothetical protein